MTTTSRNVARARKVSSSQPQTAGSSLASAGEWLRSPVAPYYLVLISVASLVSIGLVMVLSASTVQEYAATGNSYGLFLQQLMFMSIGVALAYIASRLPIAWWKRLAIPGMFLAIGLQALVFSPLGVDFKATATGFPWAGKPCSLPSLPRWQ
ncbi:FtsW/RodA/SpoVE family cell cycle protein [Ornithinimicrobium sp. INDO-MA30-4]|uniref:FtsW/RodA/SpoVE family cell cycle protein n=1 Tax=Ornithinimicrobium sp. INDO-MA30-4 TaxID=2908651 RepID=UPI001F41EB30|nr:FtsW/RodA/SpoVE family cell cycle protein [Ornithinimicrobium sp. INDO-MA30-4]UJH71343.1 FtsW/RodA/SpoVE family cell cycle protein [Ornithinimicrobium sp. INDO-MA30-4]